MNIQVHKIAGTEIAEIISDEIIIKNIDDGLDVLGNVYYQGFDKVIIYEQNITPDFFDLKNKMAGEILQKFSNYRIFLFIVGTFTAFRSKSLAEFIRESNKGRQVNFVSSLDDALLIVGR